VQTDKTSESLSEFFKELNAIRQPIGADELGKAKNYVALGFPGEFESLGDLSSHLEELLVYGLPDTYFNEYVGNIQRSPPRPCSRRPTPTSTRPRWPS
jgi:zinc protease